MSKTPLKDARELGIECIGIGNGNSRIPTQAEVDQEQENLKSPEEIKTEKILIMTEAIQVHLDVTAQSYGYDNINTIAKYIGYPNTFQTECIALGTWCSSCWDYAYQTLAEIDAETRTEPTPEELIAELPIYIKP